jgi:hypothetical protein
VYNFLQAHLHEKDVGEEVDDGEAVDNSSEEAGNDPTTDTLLIHAAKMGISSEKLLPGNIRQVTSKNSMRSVKMADIAYTVSMHKKATNQLLVDCGTMSASSSRRIALVWTYVASTTTK